MWLTVRIVAIASLALVGAACQRGEALVAYARVSDDSRVQAKYEAAVRTLAEIRRRSRVESDCFADCKTAEILFYRDLEKLSAPPARALLADLKTACESSRRAPTGR